MINQLNLVLVIDDDPITTKSVMIGLTSSGLAKEAVSVSSADDALIFLEKRVMGREKFPDLILLDLEMPRMNGWEFVDRYAEKFGDRACKLIIMSGTEHANDLIKAELNDMVTDLITKPFDIDDLKNVIRPILKAS